MKSKYLQSDLNEIFNSVRKFLNEGIQVLFSGTPCQCAALRTFLKKQYDNLFLIDIICHGVPSPKILNFYLNYYTNKNKIDISQDESVDFRNKDFGRVKFSLKIGKYEPILKNDPENYFYKVFLSDIALRYSCYNCNFKGDNRASDLTLGDFWGFDRYSEASDLSNFDKGLSVIVSHTKKGDEFLKRINNINIVLSNKDILKQNPNYYVSTKMPLKRKTFLLEINENNFSTKAIRATKKPLLQRTIYAFKKKIKKIYNSLFK